MKPSPLSLFLATLILAAVVVAGCTQAPPQGRGNSGVTVTGTYTPPATFDPGDDVQARHFDSEDDLRAFIRGNNAGGGGYGGGILYAQREAAAPMAADSNAGVAKTTSAPAPSGFSGTNNQVAGVDEADILKTDGQYIYTLTGNTLFIVKAVPGEDARVVKTLDVDRHVAHGVALHDDGRRVVAVLRA